MPGLAEEEVDAVLGERAEKHFARDRLAFDAALHVHPLRFVIVGHVLLGPAGTDNAGGARGAMNKRMGEA